MSHVTLAFKLGCTAAFLLRQRFAFAALSIYACIACPVGVMFKSGPPLRDGTGRQGKCARK